MSEPLSSRATIRDVSRLAGVSIKSVSRVLNNQKYVSAATRERIEAAMSELGFHPSFAARTLAGGRSHQIALICDNPSPWYVYEVQLGARARCQIEGVRMLAQPYDRETPTLLRDVVSLIDQVAPDGLILTPPACDDPELLATLRARDIPFVRIQPGIQVDLVPSVHIDNEQGAFDMTRHLLELGHRRIGFIIGDRGYAVSAQRLNGYVRALSEAGLGLDLGLVRQGKFDFETGAEAAASLLDQPDRPTAIFASNDAMAAGALATAHKKGLSVPADLSIAGFDDISLASIVWPALTTIHQPIRALAEAAADLLMTQAGPAERRCLEHRLVVRDSTGPAPGV
jgi:LacI family transcriptional regulator